MVHVLPAAGAAPGADAVRARGAARACWPRSLCAALLSGCALFAQARLGAAAAAGPHRARWSTPRACTAPSSRTACRSSCSRTRGCRSSPLGVAVRRGAAQEALGEAGLATFTAELMTRGAGARDALELAQVSTTSAPSLDTQRGLGLA